MHTAAVQISLDQAEAPIALRPRALEPNILGTLREDVGETIRIDGLGSDDDVDCFPKPFDLAGFRLKVSEKLLANVFSGDSGCVIDVIFGEDLFRRLQMYLDVLKREAWIKRAVKKS